MRTLTITCLALLALATTAGASGFFDPYSGPLWDGSYDPGYTPTATMYFTGSLYTIDTDGDGLGAEGIVSFGDFSMTSLGGNVISPATSLRAFNVLVKNGQPDGETGAPVVNNDAFPSWTPDTPDADANWNTPRGEYYGLDMALGAGKALSTLPSGLDWAVTLYPYDLSNPGNIVQPYSGVVQQFSVAWDPANDGSGPPASHGPGSVYDKMYTTSLLKETDGQWDVDYGADGTDDESFALLFDRFLAQSTLYEVGNSFTITAPGGGTWTLNEWSSIDPVSGAQELNGISPVPEPLTMLGVFGGIAGVGAYIRRRRRMA